MWSTIGSALEDAFLMAWEVWWALVLGFALSAVVQAWVPRERIERSLAGGGARPIALATTLGAASSSCSYAAIAIAKSLFEKGASAAASMAFQFASTNLVLELGLVIWVLIGWQFTLAELVGGALMVALMALLLRVFISPAAERRAREHASRAQITHQHHATSAAGRLRERIQSLVAWSDVAHNFRNDWSMLWKEITAGFLLAGLIAQFHNSVFATLFVKHAPGGVRVLENALAGPLVAIISFVCSVGNVPLAAVLWSGGISFAGVIAFVFADLLVAPIIVIYRKYYGGAYALQMAVLMFVTVVLAALVIEGIFNAAGLIPHMRPTRADVFGSVGVDYKLFADIAATIAFAALFLLTVINGASDPVCGMRVDRTRALPSDFAGRRYFFCSARCLHAFQADPQRHARRRRAGPIEAKAAGVR